jgi:hypothetical protein
LSIACAGVAVVAGYIASTEVVKRWFFASGQR